MDNDGLPVLSDPMLVRWFNQIKDALLASGKFTADPSEHIKLYYNQELEVDLIPFGKIS